MLRWLNSLLNRENEVSIGRRQLLMTGVALPSTSSALIPSAPPEQNGRLGGNFETPDFISSTKVVTVNQASAGEVIRRIADKLQEWVSPEDFGASVTADDNSAHIHEAFRAAAARNVPVRGRGRYRCLSAVVLPAVDVEGEITLDYSHSRIKSTYVTLTGGSPVLLTRITGIARQGATSFSVLNSSEIAKGDILIIANQRPYSWSKFRRSYRAGEIAEVISVSGSEVTVMLPLFDSYDSNSNDAYPINVYKHPAKRIRSVGLKVVPRAGDNFPALKLSYLSYSELRDCSGSDSDYANVEYRCLFKCSITSSGRSNTERATAEAQYSIRIVDSQNLDLIGGSNVSARHGITISATGGEYTVVNRFIKVIDAFVGTTGEGKQPALDTHGNSEYLTFVNCDIVGGVNLSGDHITLRGGRVLCQESHGRGTCIQGAECRGLNRTISDVDIYFSGMPRHNSRGFVFDFGGNDQGVGAFTTQPSTLFISSVRVHLSLHGDTTAQIGRIFNRGSVADLCVNISNVDIISTGRRRSGCFSISSLSGSPFSKICIRNYASFGSGLSIVGRDGGSDRKGSHPYVSLFNIELDSPKGRGIELQCVDFLLIDSSKIIGSENSSIYIDFRDFAPIGYRSSSGFIKNTSALNCFSGRQSIFGDDSSCVFLNAAKRVELSGCTLGTESVAQEFRYRAANLDEFAVGNNYTFGPGINSVSSVAAIINI